MTNFALIQTNADLATLLVQQEVCLRNLEEMLAARWHASQSLMTLHSRTLGAFETAFPAPEEIANIPIKQRHAALAKFTALLSESTHAVQELLAQDDALRPPLHMLGIEVPEGIGRPNPLPNQQPNPAQT